MSAATRKPRLTPVQRDVLERMRDGWELRRDFVMNRASIRYGYQLQKPGEPRRYVAAVTIESLKRRGYLEAVTLA